MSEVEEIAVIKWEHVDDGDDSIYFNGQAVAMIAFVAFVLGAIILGIIYLTPETG